MRSSAPKIGHGSDIFWQESALLILSLIAAACWLWRPIRYANDVWWHLATGRFIFSHGYIPKADVFSWTVRGRRWINHEWLFQMVLYSIYKLIRISGIIALKILLIEEALVFQWFKMKREGTSWLIRWTWLALMFWASRYGWNERADLVSVFFLSWLIWLMSAYRFKKSGGWNLWSGILLFALWANSHGGFVLGLVISFLYILGMSFEYPIGKMQKPFLWFVAGVAATFLNPNGYRLHLSTLQGLALLRQGFFTEWQKTPWHPLELFWACLLLYGVLFFRNHQENHRWPWPEAAMGSFLAWGAVNHVRNIPYFMIGAFPDAALWMSRSEVGEKIADLSKRHARLFLIGIGFIIGAFGVTAATSIRGGVNKRFFPIEACDFIQHERLPGTFYNEDGFGGYWIWYFGDTRPVFLDGRFHTVEGYIDLYNQVQHAQTNTPEVWNQFLDQRGIDAALMSYPQDPLLPSVFRLFFPRSRWALIYWDDVALIYVRRLPQFAPYIQKWEFPAIDPDGTPEDFQNQWRQSATAKTLLLKDLRRNAALHPDSHRTAAFLYAIDRPQ